VQRDRTQRADLGSRALNELALFAGAGGGLLASRLLGWRTVCAVEIDPYARDVLMARQNDGCLDPFPIWDDVRTFDGRAWRGSIDVVTAGWPCTDISVAGRGAGIKGKQSGLWTEVARILAEVRPRACLLENSPALTTRGLGTVLGDLAAMGFATEHGVLGAHHTGAPHKRDRIWIVAADAKRVELRDESRRRHGTNRQSATQLADDGTKESVADACSAGWWQTEPDVGRVADGVASRLDRLRCIGNGQVPAVAALAWRTLIRRKVSEGIKEKG
jgi:DNA (cytosine-5)-methyltransferase 1